MLNKLLADLIKQSDLSTGAVILPTQRLCLYCHAELARNKNALYPPLITTLDNFLIHLQDDLKQPIVSEGHAEFLIEHLLQDSPHLHPRFAKETNHLLREFTQSNIRDMHCLDQALAADTYIDNDDYLQRQRNIHTELEKLYHSLQNKLTADNHTTDYFALQTQVDELLASQTLNTKLNKFSFIYVIPHLYTTTLQQKILRKLDSTNKAKFFLPENMLANKHLPYRLHTTITQLKSPITSKANTHHQQAIALPSPAAEIYYALSKAQTLLNSCNPADIAIVLTDSNYYLPYLLLQRSSFDFPMYISLPVPMRMTSIGMFLQALCDYQLNARKKLPALLDLLHSPHTTHILPQAFAHKLNDLNDIALALAKMDMRADPSALQGHAKDYATHINSYMQGYRSDTSMHQQIERFEKLLAQLAFDSQEHYENSSIQSLLESLVMLKNSHISRNKLSADKFWRYIADKFLGTKLLMTGEKLAGVQVISLNDACYMQYQHMYVLGCVEGMLPRKLERDFIISNSLRKRIGLTAWAEYEALEEARFALLCASGKHLYFCYPDNAVPSRFLPKASVELSPAQVYNLTPTNAVPSLDDYPKQTETIEYLSATRLESLLQCPLRFLLQQLEIKTLELRDYPSPLDEGNCLHETIETLINSADYQTIRNSAPQAEQIDMLVKKLQEIATRIFPANQTIAISQHYYGWRKLAGFLLSDYFAHVRREFGEQKITVNSASMKLTGKIDHVIFNADTVWIIDYKRSSIPEHKQVADMLMPQLVFYAYIYEHQQQLLNKPSIIANAVLAYFSMLKGETKVIAAGSAAHALVRKKGAKILALEELIDKMQTELATRIQELQAHGFFIDTKRCKTCRYPGICRIQTTNTRTYYATR